MSSSNDEDVDNNNNNETIEEDKEEGEKGSVTKNGAPLSNDIEEKNRKALIEFQKLLDDADSDEDTSTEDTKDDDLELDEMGSLVGSDKLASMIVAPSHKSMGMMPSSENSVEDLGAAAAAIAIGSSRVGEELKPAKKKSTLVYGDDFNEANMLNTLANIQETSSDNYYTSSDYLDINLTAETLALIEEDDDEDETQIDESVSDEIIVTKLIDEEKHKLKKTAITILLTHKWQKPRKKRSKASIKYQPTYRMEPKINLNQIKHHIFNKAYQTFESLIEKHGTYDTEYTPRFLRIITEMIKNDVKSFKLDRYKTVVYVTFLKKVLGQSVHFISKCLFNPDHDHRICLKLDTKSFYAVCLIFLVYHE